MKSLYPRSGRRSVYLGQIGQCTVTYGDVYNQIYDINLRFWIPNHPETPLRAQGCEDPLFFEAKGTREQNILENTGLNLVYHVNKCWAKDGAASTMATARDGQSRVRIAT